MNPQPLLYEPILRKYQTTSNQSVSGPTTPKQVDLSGLDEISYLLVRDPGTCWKCPFEMLLLCIHIRQQNAPELQGLEYSKRGETNSVT